MKDDEFKMGIELLLEIRQETRVVESVCRSGDHLRSRRANGRGGE